jgi:elongation factor G
MPQSEPNPIPSGSRPPPRPPKLTATGLDDHNDKRRFTVTKAADGEGKFIRKAHYGHVVVRLEPSSRGKGVTILNEMTEGAIPDRFVSSMTEGIRESLVFGIEGAPVVDVAVRILDGSWNSHDSGDLDFKMAGIFAIKDAIKHAEPVSID